MKLYVIVRTSTEESLDGWHHFVGVRQHKEDAQNFVDDCNTMFDDWKYSIDEYDLQIHEQ